MMNKFNLDLHGKYMNFFFFFFFFLRNQVYDLINRIMFWRLMTWIVQGSGLLYHSSLASNFYYIMFWLLSCNVWDGS